MNWFKKIVSKVSSSRDEGPELFAIKASIPHMDTFEFLIHSRPDQYISGDLLRDKIWEPCETEIFRCICRPGDFVVDIRANIGWYSVIASRLVGATRRVLSVGAAYQSEVFRRMVRAGLQDQNTCEQPSTEAAEIPVSS